MSNRLLSWLLLLTMLLAPMPEATSAAPVEWIEVPSTSEGQQWWDKGSLRLNRRGELTVLSRFTPAASDDTPKPSGQLYVMAIECGSQRFRDLQVNGLPKLQAEWEIAAEDALISSVMEQVCVEAQQQGLA